MPDFFLIGAGIRGTASLSASGSSSKEIGSGGGGGSSGE